MSLSTQLARGTMALTLLAMFGLLAAVAGPMPAAVALPIPVTDTGVGSEPCATPPRTVLVLAQAPADLGELAVRWSHPCEA